MDYWNDDERDTSSSSLCRICKDSNSERFVSISDIIRDFHKEERESMYTWSDDDYRREASRRIARSIMLMHVPTKSLKKSEPVSDEKVQKDDTLDDSIDENSVETSAQHEVNDEILEKEIYRKCWYS